MEIIRKISNIFMCLALFIGCSTMKNDIWYSKPLNTSDYKKSETQFDVVVFDKVPQAIKLLNDKSIIEIDDDQCLYFTGKKKNISKKAFLVRSLYYAFNENGFRVWQDQESIWIRHGALTTSKKMYKYALVVYLDSIPESVFVSCSAAK